MTRAAARPFAVLWCAVVLLAASACATQPEVAPAEAATPLPWPTRAATHVEEVEVGPWMLRWVGEFGLGGQEADRTDAQIVAAILGLQEQAVKFEGEGSIVVRMPEGDLSRTARLAGKPIAAYQVLTGDQLENETVQLQRTWFVLYDPRGDDEPRGVVVLFPGMFGTPEPVIDTLVGMLRSRGWHVLRMLTHSSRFTEKASYTLDPEDGLGTEAGLIAADFGDRAAECAIATEAMCAYIRETRPDVPIDSRVALGMSGGGMVLPTVIARDPEPYDAAVFIGAGCDFASIAIESNYADWIDAVRIGWASEPSDLDRTVFALSYRDAAPLDSYNTAPLMADIPTLMLHGKSDRAVPASLGDLLWTRLGEPERWTAPGGHEVLFLGYLPFKTLALLDWLDEEVARFSEP